MRATIIGLSAALWLLLAAAPPARGQGSSTLVGIADKTCTVTPVQIVQGNQSRAALICTNNDGANSVRLGDQNVGTASGVRVRAGASPTITSKGAIFCIREGAADVVLSCSQELE